MSRSRSSRGEVSSPYLPHSPPRRPFRAPMKLKSILPSLALIAAVLTTCGGCATRPQEKTKVRALIAGSLMIPFDALEKAFEAERADIDVEMEAHGSIQVIRHVTEIHELSDLVFTADHALIPMLMYQSA